MAVSSKVYGLSLLSLATGAVNFTGSTVRAMLCTSAYTPNQDTHQFKSAVTNEITGTGYTSGGATLTSKTANYDATTNTLSLDSADPSWAGASFTARYLVFYVDTGTSATSPLLSYVDFGADVTVTTSVFTYQIPASGFYQLTAAA